MRRSTIFWLTGITIIIVAVFLVYNNLAPSVTAQGVNMKGTIRQTATDEYEVQLTITRTKEDKGQHIVYPFVPGWGSISFVDKQDSRFIQPTSVGSTGAMEEILRQALQRQTSTAITEFVGFSIPDTVGTYKMRFTIHPLGEKAELIRQPMIYYVHQEKVLGKDLSWVSGEPLEIIKEYAE
ncbi:hypothetical protein QP794_03275 [Paenibacillus sp. UMB7766-LJ446]|uniref:hypothetical protein n=1 Tax=Paenibacillus sp. UMB7766-LJ446 TaxID=3046313 RepID=UPI00254ED5FA|nr:hypothetical protein [Paenibacillus sp. UMB7766-LJ446]MDK8189104.1 hypothetical protein [Paenibacillus sp. UMB7766-LJ446]